MENAGLTSAVLSDLIKIPTKEFEEEFRKWMERDEVTRTLQAKLRCDLISNFNKTALGRHIMSQTTMTTSGVYGGAKTHRLTLSPVVLALNTLVAEFLYAENCHYSLSVFCTEVPFRNTLPDFDVRTPFRFATTELHELMGAFVSTKAVEQQLSSNVMPKYTSSNTSLLFLLLEYLLANSETKDWPKLNEHKSTMTKANTTSTSSNSSSKKEEMQHLNKYLAMLSRKLETMLKQFEKMQNVKTQWKTRRRPKSRQILNRMSNQLKKLTQEKVYNKQLKSVFTAINVLGQQFEGCANNFAQIYDETKCKEEPKIQYMQKQSSTQTEEKPYAEWLREMCETHNGKKFLNRVERSLKKTLNIQKVELHAEVTEKLEQQKTLLKIRYKQKLIDHIAQQPTAPMDEVFTELQQQLKDLHLEYNKLLQKLKENEQQENISKPVETQTSTAMALDSARKRTRDGKKLALDEMKHIHSFMENLQLADPSVNNLLQNAKSRLKALNDESNEIEQQVTTCLARLQKRTIPIVNPLDTDRSSPKISNSTQTPDKAIVATDVIEISEDEEELLALSLKCKEIEKKQHVLKKDRNIKFENAFSNAKKTFFENMEKRKQAGIDAAKTLATEVPTVVLQKSTQKINRLFSANLTQTFDISAPKNQHADITFIKES